MRKRICACLWSERYTRAPNRDKHTKGDRFFWWTVPPPVSGPALQIAPPSLTCSTTFSDRKIIFTITIGFLAPLVLGNASACIRVPLAPRAWPPNRDLAGQDLLGPMDLWDRMMTITTVFTLNDAIIYLSSRSYNNTVMSQLSMPPLLARKA